MKEGIHIFPILQAIQPVTAVGD